MEFVLIAITFTLLQFLFPPLSSSSILSPPPKNAATEKVALVGAAFSVANYWNLLDNLAE